jgi:hypothetical protein
MKSLFSLLLGFAFCIALPCEAKSHAKHTAKKTYVNPEAVRVTKDGVFLLKDGTLFPVKGVFKDRRGVFVMEKRFFVRCQTCRKLYDADRNHHCPFCGHL